MQDSELRIQIEPDGAGFCRTVATVFAPLRRIEGVIHWIEIPAGYRFDGASIPRCLWSLIGGPFDPQFALAACIHDWYCEHTSECYESRVIGDAVFFYLLRLAGVPKWKRTLMFLGVRLNSWFFYGRKSK